jgi:hypothetical protein
MKTRCGPQTSASFRFDRCRMRLTCIQRSSVVRSYECHLGSPVRENCTPGSAPARLAVHRLNRCAPEAAEPFVLETWRKLFAEGGEIGSIDVLTRGLDPCLHSEIQTAQGDTQAAEDLEIANRDAVASGCFFLGIVAGLRPCRCMAALVSRIAARCAMTAIAVFSLVRSWVRCRLALTSAIGSLPYPVVGVEAACDLHVCSLAEGGLRPLPQSAPPMPTP